MARTSHGDDLTQLVEQVGARFTTSKQGFDTGTRMFLVDEAYAERRAPKLDAADSVYRKMFVSSLDFANEELGRVLITVNYQGIIADGNTKKKTEGEVTISTGTQDESYRIIGTSINARFVTPIPTVSHVYVADERPSLKEIGTIKQPPQVSRSEFSVNNLWFFPYVQPGTITFAEWLLTDRSMKSAGGKIWEVSDTYTYRIVRYDD